MAKVYIGAPPQANPNAPVVAGVYLRLGTYVNDSAKNIDEAVYMPATYTGGGPASEGIFITSSGTYIVTALDEGHIELLQGAKLTVTGDDGDVTTIVEEGNVSITMPNGSSTQSNGKSADGAFKLQGKSSYKIESTDGDISITAADGKVSSKGDYVYTHTYGAYIKMNAGQKKSGVTKTSTNVSLSINLSIYLAALVSTVMASLSFTLWNASHKGFILGVGGLQFDFNTINSAVLSYDYKYSLIYLKFRGIQLEGALVKQENAKLETSNKLVSAKQALAEVKAKGVESASGLTAKFP